MNVEATQPSAGPAPGAGARSAIGRPWRREAPEFGYGPVSTNTVEGFFSIFKRGMKGVYQHCGEQHLQRYLTEFDFRYNTRKITDSERADLALQGITGKRLTYRRSA